MSVSSNSLGSTRSAGAGLPVAVASESNVARTVTPKDSNEQLTALLRRAGFERTEDGQLVVRDSASVRQAGATSTTGGAYLTGGVAAKIDLPTVPSVQMTSELRQGAMQFADNMDQAFNGMLTANSAASADASRDASYGLLKSSSQLTSDDLLAAFLKLNITDPNNTVETHNALANLMSECRKMAIDEAKKKIAEAEKERKEAEEAAGFFELISTIVTIISIVAAVFTFGASLAASAATQAATQAATEAAKQAMQEALKEALKEGLKEAGKEALQEALTTTLKDQVVQTTLDQAGKAAANEAMQKAAMEAAKKGLEPLTEEALKKIGEEAYKKTVEKLTEEFIKNGGQELLKQGLDRASVEAAQASARETGKSLVSKAGENVTTEMAKAVGNKGTELGKQMAERQTMSRAVNGGGTVAKGVAEYNVNKAMADAEQARLQGERLRKLAEQYQESLQEENEIISMIMESKNRMVDAVIGMMTAAHAVKVKQMAAGAAK